jgi:polyisoprenoid-binding protein YceI
MEATNGRCRRRFPCCARDDPDSSEVCEPRERISQLHQPAKEFTTVAWEIDAVHSSVGFSVRHMMVSTVHGNFTVMRGQLHIDEQEPAQSWIEAEVDAASVDTRNAQRDAHLRSGDFFDVERYPIITFKSTRVERVGDQEFTVTGDLTMHGVTRSVTFDGEYSGQSNLMDKQRAGLSARTKVNRKDFDLAYGTLVEATRGVVGELVTVELDLEVVPQTAAEPATTAPAS